MDLFKELYEGLTAINEGTPATIAVLQKDGKVKVSFLQYDGYPQVAGKELKDNFSSDVKANELVQKSGELRGFWDGQVEYYTDRKMLKTYKDLDTYLAKGQGEYGVAHNYFWDGENWLYGKIKTITTKGKVL